MLFIKMILANKLNRDKGRGRKRLLGRLFPKSRQVIMVAWTTI
jgi:hypothetical protein